MMGSVQTIFMGDPSHFSIRSGSNPHTRTRWGFRKKVDLSRAKQQWHHLARLFTDRGIRVIVLPSVKENPGSVFPANAGFLYPKEKFSSDPVFYLSNLTPGRTGERSLYQDFLGRLGFALGDLPYPFEGEADFIQTEVGFLFTSGAICKQRFVPRWGIPPYRRIYGFRSDVHNFDHLKQIVGKEKILSLTLTNEFFYHGDTVLSPFGSRKEFLLAYLPALAPGSQEVLSDLLQERLMPLEEHDAFQFAANGFQIETEGIPHFVLPQGTSETLLRAIAQRGVKVLTADVSEFSEKGGGSVKCLLCDLGWVDLESGNFSDEQLRFWQERSYTHLYS